LERYPGVTMPNAQVDGLAIITKDGTAMVTPEMRLLFEFARLFDYGEENDRAIAIVGPAFLDTLLSEMLTNFLVDDHKEVQRLIHPEGPLGTSQRWPPIAIDQPHECATLSRIGRSEV